MKISKRVFAAVLTLLMLLPLAACGDEEKEQKTSDTETEKGTEMNIPEEDVPLYLKEHSDCESAEKWIKDNIDGSDVPPVSFTAGGKKASELNWRKEAGEPVTVTDYPESDSPAKRTYREMKYICDDEQIEILLTLTVYPNYPVVEMSSYLINLSAENSVKIKDLCAYAEFFAADEYTVHYNYGSRYVPEEYMPCTAKLNEKKAFGIENSDGMASSDYIPYFNIENEKDGCGIIAAVNWQGDWTADCKLKDGKLKLTAGQNGTNFVMFGNESFRNSGLVLLFYKNGDWQYGQNVWRRWVTEHNLMRNTGRRDFKQNVFVGSSIAGGAGADLRVIKQLAKTDIPEKFNCVFEIDAGWYTIDRTRGSWWDTGTYEPDPELYPSEKMKELSKSCADAGIGFCLWMEPERFVSRTDEAKALGKENYFTAPGSTYFLINYGKKEAQDYAVSLIDGVVKEYGLTVYRQDFNLSKDFNISCRAFWDEADRKEEKSSGVKRAGAAQNHYCEGYINVLTRVAELNPGLIFDCCAGGGRRYDIESMRFGFMHTKSDYWGDVNSAQCQNLASLSWFIFTGTGIADANSKYDVRSRLTLSAGIVAETANSFGKALSEWDSLQKYMYNDYYAISEYSLEPGANIAMQFDDAENGEGMMIAYLRRGGVYSLCAKALEEDSAYRVWNKDTPEDVTEMTGKELKENGYEVKYGKKAPAAYVVMYEKVK